MDIVVEVDGNPEYRQHEAKRAKVTVTVGGVKVTLRVRPVSSRGIGNAPTVQTPDLGVSELTLELATPSAGGPRVQSRLQQVIPVA